MLKLKAEGPVTVLGYGPWDEGNPRMGEFIRYQVPGEERTRRDTLSRDINGDRPEEGSAVILSFEERLVAKPFKRRGGDELDVRYVPKRRVVALEAA